MMAIEQFNLFSNQNQQMNPNVSSSSLSDTSQVRYAKAVKQISKLIGVNNTIKRDAQNYKVMCQNYQFQNNQLFQNLEQVTNEKKVLQAKVSQYQNLLQQQQTKTNAKQSSISNQQLEQERNKHHEQLIILNQKLNQQGNTIAHFEDRIGQLQKQNKLVNANLQKAKKQLQQQILSKSNAQCAKCPEYLKKMNEAIQFRTVLEQQFLQMRKRQLSSYNPSSQSQAHNYSYPYKHEQRNKQVKEHVIWNLQQKVRYLQQKYKRKNIEIYKLESKIQKYQEQLKKYKSKLINSHNHVKGEHLS